MHLIVCSYNGTYAFQSEYTLYSDIHATIKCGFTLERVRDMIKHTVIKIMENVKRSKQSTLRELIFPGTKFPKFCEFWLTSQKLGPAEFISKLPVHEILKSNSSKNSRFLNQVNQVSG